MPAANPSIEKFPALESLKNFRHAFIRRIPGIDVCTDRETALDRLANRHLALRRGAEMGNDAFITAEQVHGNQVEIVDAETPAPLANCDALITNAPGVCLGIYVADCCAVYAVAPKQRAIGLAHSGKKGTESQIVPRMIQKVRDAFGVPASELVVQLSPCIRPPFYETDIPTEIIRQCRESGVEKIIDCGICTAANRDLYYSYRMEKGKTGRMLALLSII